MKHRKKIQEPIADKVFNVCNMIFLFLSFILVAYPLLYIVSASLSDSSAVIRGEVWLFPVGFELKAYQAIFSNKMIMTGYLNSILYTVLGTCFNLFLTTLAAYPLSRKKLYGRPVLTWVFMFTMFFSGGLIPVYSDERPAPDEHHMGDRHLRRHLDLQHDRHAELFTELHSRRPL